MLERVPLERFRVAFFDLNVDSLDSFSDSSDLFSILPLLSKYHCDDSEGGENRTADDYEFCAGALEELANFLSE